MTHEDYYRILGLPCDASIEEIKRAYRKKAYQYHPDINKSPGAKDQFIAATEAYDFLIANHDRLQADDLAFQQAMEDWRKYRQDRSRMRANSYARASYNNFRKTNFYKTTRIFDATRAVYGLTISIIVIVYTIYGYTYRLKHPWRDEKPSFVAFILLLTLGFVFLGFSLVYVKVWIANYRKRSKRK